MQKPPTPFCYNPKQVKAIVLGADPSNFSDNGDPKILTKVFGIGDGDARYFQGILSNLKEIGLSLENIYVDNLIQEYLDEETSRNKNWDKIAEVNIPLLKNRLDKFDKTRKIPVLLTAEKIYKVLLNDDVIKSKPSEIYSDAFIIPIPSLQNKLKRPLIPFFRNLDYSLSRQNIYKEKLSKIFKEK